MNARDERGPWRERLLGPALLLPLLMFWSTLDRSIILPLVPIIADDFGASITTAAISVSGYTLAFALMQLIWGPISAIWGRIRVLVLSTAIAALANLLTAVAPDIVWFIAARIASGAAFAAGFAAALTYFGDTLPLLKRPAAMSNLATAVALGVAFGTLIAGGLAETVSWRWMYAVYAVVAALFVPLIARLSDPHADRGQPIGRQFVLLARNPWAVTILAIMVLEGVLLFGLFNMFPTALQQYGSTVFAAGLVTGVFGFAVVLVSQLMKLVVARVPQWCLIVAGGACSALAYGLLVFGVTPLLMLGAASLLGAAWALAHTSMQTWMTDAAANSRTLGMTFLSISMNIGGTIGAALASAALEVDAFGPLMLASLVASLVFAAWAGLVRARYRPSE